MIIDKKESSGITLKHLREFIEECKDLNENTILIINYSDKHSPIAQEIIYNNIIDNSIEIYNW